jgi:hypothetical protein
VPVRARKAERASTTERAGTTERPDSAGKDKPSEISGMRRLIAGLMSVAVMSTQLQGQGESDRVVLERTACLGSCPVYRVEISSTGLVTFTGTAYVMKTNGTRRVDPRTFRSVMTHLDRAGFFKLNSLQSGVPGCTRGVTDAPSASLSVVDRGRKKILSLYYGCKGDTATDTYPGAALARLDTLTRYVDSVAGTDEWAPTQGPRTKPVHHYIYVGRDRELLRTNTTLVDNNVFEGVQIMYPWAQLEHGRDDYDFSTIREDLALLTSKHKKLWIQLSDVSFSNEHTNVPKYLTTDSTYHGGVAQQYQIQGDDESTGKPAGFVARRWDPAVQERFHKLLSALGKEFDGKIEGINLTETSITFGSSGKFFPAGWKRENYPAAVVTNFKALKLAFPRSVAIQYANFMPGEWRPTNDKYYLSRVYWEAQKANVGVGGPDLMPYQPGQLKSSYPLISQAAGRVPTGIAVQDGNLEEINPDTHKPVTVTELLDFALNNLKVDYIFWGTQEPYFSRDVLPTLSNKGKH